MNKRIYYKKKHYVHTFIRIGTQNFLYRVGKSDSFQPGTNIQSWSQLEEDKYFEKQYQMFPGKFSRNTITAIQILYICCINHSKKTIDLFLFLHNRLVPEKTV